MAEDDPGTGLIQDATGALVSGYGFVNTFNGNGSQPRTGQMVARFSF